MFKQLGSRVKWATLKLRIVQLIFIGGAVALALFPPSTTWVEHIYSNQFYPATQFWSIPLTDIVPFPVGDGLFIVLVVGLLVWWSLSLRASGFRRRLATALVLAFDTLTLGACLYLLFLGLWGLNYSREPLTAKVDYNAQQITRAAEHALLLQTIQQLNAESVTVHSQPLPGEDVVVNHLFAASVNTLSLLGTRAPLLPALPKTSLFDVYFEATGVTGFTDPFTHEVTLTASLLPIERPFVLAHEWSHVAGYADESEANFIGFLTCERSDLPLARYSGWLALYSYLPKPPESPAPLAPQVASDLAAIQARIRRTKNEAASRVETQAYDRYLKANRVEAGIGSYGLFVRLILGTQFGSDWVPLPRN
jgi:Protein of unknown function (DUF3810)